MDLVLDIVVLIKLVHQLYIDEYKYDENINRTLLSKPKSEFESPNTDLIQFIYKQYPKPKGYKKPDTQEYGQISQILFPVLFHKIRSVGFQATPNLWKYWMKCKN
jgi:hypothetical protein